MTTEFNWLVALSVFTAYFFIDILIAYYTVSVVRGNALKSSHSGAAVYLLTSYGVINYTHNWWYIVFVVLGAWLGTYAYVKWNS